MFQKRNTLKNYGTFNLNPLVVCKIKKWEIPLGLWLKGTRTVNAKQQDCEERLTTKEPIGSRVRTFKIVSF